MRSTWKIGSRPRIAHSALADQHAQRDADDRRELKPMATRLRTLGDLPEGALVDAAIVVERIDDELPGVGHHLGRRRQRRARLRSTGAARRTGSAPITMTGGDHHAPSVPRGLAQPLAAPAAPAAGRPRSRRVAPGTGTAAATDARVGVAALPSRHLLDLQRGEIGLGIGRIEHLAVEEGLLAARAWSWECRPPRRRCSWPPRATCPRD